MSTKKKAEPEAGTITHVSMIEFAEINGRRVGPRDGVITVGHDQGQSLIDSGQAVDVSADFAAEDLAHAVAGSAPAAKAVDAPDAPAASETEPKNTTPATAPAVAVEKDA